MAAVLHPAGCRTHGQGFLTWRQGGRSPQSWGTGVAGYAGDGGPARQARLDNPSTSGSTARATSSLPTRSITASAGSTHRLASSPPSQAPAPPVFQDGRLARQAQLNEPYGIAIGGDGSIYIADRLNRRVRRVDGASGIITTIAGQAGAELVEPNDVALDPAQRLLYIADVADHRIRVLDLSTSVLSDFAGTGIGRHGGDGGPAAEAAIFGARAVAAVADGSVYILERQGSTLRRVRDGIIETVAGTGQRGYAGDGGDALLATFNAPKEMAVDAASNVLIVDTETHVIRRIDAESGIVTTIAGTGVAGGDGDGGPATASGLARPHGVAIGPDGTIYIGDSENHRIRQLTPTT